MQDRGVGGTVMMSKPQHCFNALLSTTIYDFHFFILLAEILKRKKV